MCFVDGIFSKNQSNQESKITADNESTSDPHHYEATKAVAKKAQKQF